MAQMIPKSSSGVRRLPPSRRVPVSCVFCGINLKHRQSYQDHLQVHTKEKPNFCKICSKELRQKSQMAYHIKLHGDMSKPNKCRSCTRSFRLEQQLTVHMKVHSIEKPFKCEMCPKTFTIKSSLTVHVRGHNQQVHECDKCFRRFIFKHRLQQHIQSVHKMSATQNCPICKKTLSDSTAMSVHMRTHTGEKPYKCKQCENAYKYPADLRRHLQQMHFTQTPSSLAPREKSGRGTNRPFKCTLCPKKFPNQLYLTKHMYTHTHREKNYSCDICRLAFQTSEKLRILGFFHSAKVANGMAICPVCEKGFTDKRQLMRHIQALHNKETYQCDLCQKKFMNQNYLKQHIKLHSGERSHKCRVCGKGFKSNNNKATHEKIHLRKRHECNICNRKYYQSANLRHHKQRVHGNDKHFECLFCSKLFGFNTDLMGHILRGHTGEKLYICKNCNKEFFCSKSIKKNACSVCRLHSISK